VADSSFYVCFLDDINRPKELKRILSELKFWLPTYILGEISNCKNFSDTVGSSNIVRLDDSYNLANILKTFVSEKQFKKGETEAIALAYVLLKMSQLHKLILDDIQARKFVKDKISALTRYTIGTVGFIGNCCCDYRFIMKDEGLLVLELIKSSKFRVKDTILKDVISRIKSCN
jgi:predicted nucleic acid-binding protein